MSLHDGRVATVVVNRSAKLNALIIEILAPLDERLDVVAVSEARVVVIRTVGGRVCCVDADIGAFSGLTPVEMRCPADHRRPPGIRPARPHAAVHYRRR